MNKQAIRYIAYFDTQDSKVRRNYVTSASNKLEYIAKSVASLGYNVDIVSMSEVREEKFRIYSSEKKQIAENVMLHLPFSWGGSCFFLKKTKILWHLVNMFFFLLLHCGKNNTIIVYHSLGYFDIIRWAKKFKKFRLVLEVEEIYSDVSQMSPYWRNLEFKMFDIADAFILSNDLLDAKINKYHKPYTVIYGTYQVEPELVKKFDDRKIHAIYAGTFDHNKGGAQTAISAVEYLPGNYHIHICGWGNEADEISVKQMINDLSIRSKATITYDGLKKGKEFIEFLQKCHIGLSTQKPEGEYNDTSFPSKVLTYMANGLAVVSIRIPVLEKAVIADSLSFYDIPDGNTLAEAIVHCKHDQSSRMLLNSLDQSFKQNLEILL